MTPFSRIVLALLFFGASMTCKKSGSHPGSIVISTEVRAIAADCADFCICEDTFLPSAMVADGATREHYLEQFTAIYSLPLSQARVLQDKNCPAADAFGYCVLALPTSEPLPVTVHRYYYSNRYPQNQAITECQAAAGRFVDISD